MSINTILVTAAEQSLGNLWSAAVYYQVMSSGDRGSHLPLFVFSSANRSELTLVAFANMTCLKGLILQISRGKLTIKLTQFSVNHPLTCHRCKCRRCGACHLECSSSAGTGCKETKVVIIDLCKITPRQEEKQVLLEYSCVGINPQLPNEALCLFLLS